MVPSKLWKAKSGHWKLTGLKSFICETEPSIESVHWEPLIGDLSKWSAKYGF